MSTRSRPDLQQKGSPSRRPALGHPCRLLVKVRTIRPASAQSRESDVAKVLRSSPTGLQLTERGHGVATASACRQQTSKCPSVLRPARDGTRLRPSLYARLEHG